MTADRQATVVCLGEAMVEFSPQGDGIWRQGFAGDTLNVAWALRKLLPGDWCVGYASRIGQDAFSRRFLAFLTAAGIDTTRLDTDPAGTIGLYAIETDSQGERSFTYWRGQSAARGLARSDAAVNRALAGARMVYLSGITLAILPPADRARLLRALADRDRSRVTLAFDPNIRPRLWEDADAMRATLIAAASLSDIVLPTFDDERAAFGDASPAMTLERYGQLGVPEVVVKDGPAPTHLAIGPSRRAFALPDVVRPVDTTGAGDAFNGGYLAARLTGLAPEDAIRRGQTAARNAVLVRGALAETYV